MILNNFKKRILTGILLFFLIFLMFANKAVFIYTILVLGILSLIEFFKISKKIFKQKITFFLINISFIFFLFIFCLLILFLNNFVHLKIILFIILCGCIASDIGGFMIGKLIKGPKLTKISPGKTISGAVGSIIFTCITVSILMYYFTNNINIKVLIPSVILSISCQSGDLLFSFLKRKAKIKDSGKIFPGHGGVLDRLDSLFIGIPFGFISLILFY